ncbi:Ldh family oxidoreductase [Thalassobaculum sp. OXR-137]|uniref:Ldh family oxidoreductase n=1 Tax=Thalassobaculum sp. OXR-137 TaxID=3100173 RepID=UPI002AC9D1D0|nr:Ldh family oxidoreductase [Thalassobaculum sp. OXR-137]WPZ34965.1 Ldh family oxidoreductase [Thalassobaculum sp. OXR-137]
MTERYAAQALIDYAEALFVGAGLPADKAALVAPLMVEADLMGHTTHGLQLVGAYLAALKDGSMTATGMPEVLSDRGPVVVWDGMRLSGVWLTASAVDLAVERARRYGTCTVSIRRSHHIACLAAFLQRATDEGMMVTLTCSDPAVASVAPFGGTRAIYTPDPMAVGIPTSGDPILIDISASITTNGLTNRLHKEGRTLEHPWLIDAEGNPSKDPAVLFTDPPGTILPVGGLDHGHKGYGLALIVEALTQGLSGHGRADPPEGWGASIWVQVQDPTAFAGADAFSRQTDRLVELCRTNPPRPGVDAVRLPGDGALARKRAALAEGVALYPGIMEGLAEWAGKLGVTPPAPL